MTFPAIDSARFDAAARTGTPVLKLPSVNLLSPKTLQRLAVRRVRRRLVAGGLVAVVFVGGGWMVQSARLTSAHQQLTDEQAATTPLNAQLTALAPIATFYSELDARKTAASQAMAAEVLFSAALADLNNRTPKNMLITNLAVTLTPSVVTAVAPPVSPLTQAGIDANGNDTTSAAAAGTASAAPLGTTTSSTPATGNTATASASAGASCAQQDPFDPTAVIGCITLSGNAPSRAVVGDFITNLKASQLYATPFITTTTVTGADGVQQVQFNGSVGLTGAAVSGRYADLGWLADPSVLAAAQAMIAAGDTASNRLAKETAALQAVAKAEAAAVAKAQAAAAAAAQLAAQNAAAQQLRAAAAAALAASQASSTGQSTSSSTTTTTTTKGK
ncbi:MAG TPA: hypothetical protein VHV82_16395 [Sporichthyaceae bacterium]|jgi:hypothetical protein|nr:hypothetical protein [Sporichthyaceae bacterium]